MTWAADVVVVNYYFLPLDASPYTIDYRLPVIPELLGRREGSRVKTQKTTSSFLGGVRSSCGLKEEEEEELVLVLTRSIRQRSQKPRFSPIGRRRRFQIE